MRNKILSVILAGALCFNGTVPVLGVGPPPDWEAAAIYVRDQGIMTGDQNGNLNPSSGLTRAELAVIPMILEIWAGTPSITVRSAP